MASTYTAGYVTAYGAAVRGGYTGTYEEFCAEQAEFGRNAAAVAQAKADVETMQGQVEQAAETFTGTTVPASVTTVQEAGAAQVQAVQDEGTMQAQAVETVGAQQTAAVGAAGSDAVDAVEAAETAATDAVTAAQTAAVQAVQTESSTQQAAIQTKGAETIASIPEDYTALSDDVDDLKSALDANAETIGKFTGNIPLVFKAGSYVGRTAGQTVTFSDAAGYVCAICEAQEGDSITYTVYAPTTASNRRGFVWLDSNMAVISSMSSVNQLMENKTIIAPVNTAYVVFNSSLSGLPSGYYAYKGAALVGRVDDAQAQIDVISEKLTIVFSDFIQKNINASTGALSDSSADLTITNDSQFSIGSVYSVKSNADNIRFFCYASDLSYLGYWDSPNPYNAADTETLLNNKPGTEFVRVRLGNTGHPVTLETWESLGIEVRLLESNSDESTGYVTRDMLAQYEGESGAFAPTGSEALTISLSVPFNGSYQNQIYTAVAKFEQAAGATDVARIRFATGSGLNGSTQYTIGGNGHFETKQWRVVRYPGDETALTVIITIPVGVTLYLQDFYNEYSDRIERVSKGLRINSHRRFPNTPNDTIPGLMMAVKSGANSMIEIPKRLSDGVWICYHDDSLTYNDTYIRQEDGTELPSTYDHTLWSSIDFDTANSWDWGISANARFAGTKPMTLEQFFTICGKTGIQPMLSIHPFDSEHLPEVRELARRCGVLADLGIKCTAANMSTAYSIFGNEVESYTLDISSGATTQATVQSAINTMTELTGCTVRRVIELFASTAYAAYFGETQFDPFGMISAAGFGCSIAQQTGRYQPTHDSSSVLIWETDMDWWRQKGVNEYAFEYHTSFGLNW